jgi:hypothetical protein
MDYFDINDHVLVANLFPHLVVEEEALLLESTCTKEEVLEVLKTFSKAKILGLDGWTVEFFLHFFDLLADELVELVEDSRTNGTVIRSLNLNFLDLIQKLNKPTSFSDFRPISLCNLCYNLIEKIIVNRVKPFLSKTLLGEQLGFLKGRQILDEIDTSHEFLHSIKQKHLKALILKLDLKKAYDCINWDFFTNDFVTNRFWSIDY